MHFKNIKNVYFIGIGGIGMSALARFFNNIGKQVSGYDKTETALTAALINEGMKIHFTDNINNISPDFISEKHQTLVVYTPAIPQEHTELKFFLKNNYNVKKRSEVLGMISNDTRTIAIAGTHGKTTTSSMVAHILRSNNINCAAFLGGIAKNYNSNFLMPQTDNDIVTVVEADEYDRSFLKLKPYIGVITSMDSDHLDIYQDKKYLEESYIQFANLISSNGLLLYNVQLPLGAVEKNKMSYSSAGKADFYAENIRIENARFVFDFVAQNKMHKGFSLQLPGRHNVENAIAACATAYHMGVDPAKISKSLESYTGVNRRFDIRVASGKTVYIDDYAHHPEELRAAIDAIKELYPGKKITGIFQPHLFSRTRDFADEFATVLSTLNEIILLEIYPARELPIDGINSQWLLNKISNPNKKLLTKQETLHNINQQADRDVLVTMGAGDIDTLVEPITALLKKQNSTKGNEL